MDRFPRRITKGHCLLFSIPHSRQAYSNRSPLDSASPYCSILAPGFLRLVDRLTRQRIRASSCPCLPGPSWYHYWYLRPCSRNSSGTFFRGLSISSFDFRHSGKLCCQNLKTGQPIYRGARVAPEAPQRIPLIGTLCPLMAEFSEARLFSTPSAVSGTPGGSRGATNKSKHSGHLPLAHRGRGGRGSGRLVGCNLKTF